MSLDQLWEVFEMTTDPQTKTLASQYVKARRVAAALSSSRVAVAAQPSKSKPTEKRSPTFDFKAIEERLGRLTARQLHELVAAEQPQQAHDAVKEFERYRAQQLLDRLLQQAGKATV